MWSSEEPIKGVNAANFSVIWKGYIKAPIEGDYTFQIENDDGAMLIVNGSAVIKDRMDAEQSNDWLKYKRKELTQAISDGN